MNEQVVMAIVGGVIGFVSSAGIIVLERILNKAGKLKLYYKFIHVKFDNTSWGIRDNREMFTLMVPVSFELQNTSNTTRVIRDLSVELYRGDKQVGRMRQIERGEFSIKEGVKSKSPFVLPPRSIQKQKCEYMYSIMKADAEKYSFDKLKISYYDERDKKKEYTAKADLAGWKMGTQEPDHEWVRLK